MEEQFEQLVKELETLSGIEMTFKAESVLSNLLCEVLNLSYFDIECHFLFKSFLAFIARAFTESTDTHPYDAILANTTLFPRLTTFLMTGFKSCLYAEELRETFIDLLFKRLARTF